MLKKQTTKKETTVVEDKIVKGEQGEGVAEVDKAIAAAPKAKAPVAHAPGPITEEDPEPVKGKEDELEVKPESEDETDTTIEFGDDKEENGDEEGTSETDKKDDDSKEDESEDESEDEQDNDESSEEETEEENNEETEEEVDMEEDVNALMNGEANLTEGFKSKAKTIFEAAVKSKLRAARKELHEGYQKKLNEKAEEILGKVTEQVDSYLMYVVESWMKENQVAVDSALRTEIAESFITSLKNVFAENYIEVPKADKNLVESLNSRIVELQEQVKKSSALNENIKKDNEKLLRTNILTEASKGLAVTQASRLKDLTKDVVFESAEAFSKKVYTIKESYFSGKAPQSNQAASIVKSAVKPQKIVNSGTNVIIEGQEDPHANASDEMKRYLSAISRVERNNPNRK